MPDVQYLFFHTAAADLDDVDAARIDKWHKARGWTGIGYHYVIIDNRHSSKADGLVESGRPESKIGAQVLGMNSRSLGVCCVGHGNKTDFTEAQKESLAALLADLARKYGVAVENILGHREVNQLVDQGVIGPEFRTSKSCPGHKVNTDEIRGLVRARLGGTAVAANESPPATDAIKNAIAVLDQNRTFFGNAQQEWLDFANNGEIRSLMEGRGV